MEFHENHQNSPKLTKTTITHGFSRKSSKLTLTHENHQNTWNFTKTTQTHENPLKTHGSSRIHENAQNFTKTAQTHENPQKHMGVHESTVQEAAHRPAAPSPAPAPAPTCLVRRLEMQSTATTVPRSKRTYLPTYLPTTSRRLASLFLTSHKGFLTSPESRSAAALLTPTGCPALGSR